MQNTTYCLCETARQNRKHLPIYLKIDKNMKSGKSDWRVSKDGITCPVVSNQNHGLKVNPIAGKI